jgi:hypothetical protein
VRLHTIIVDAKLTGFVEDINSDYQDGMEEIQIIPDRNKTAKMGGVRIIRKGPAGMTETSVPLKKMLEAKAPARRRAKHTEKQKKI